MGAGPNVWEPYAIRPSGCRDGGTGEGVQLIDQYREAIEAAIAAIPAGSVSSYGAVARRAGIPGRARLVARLLAEGGHAELPWHRVLRADGRIAFPAGSPCFRAQRRRLLAEGVELRDGRVIAAAVVEEDGNLDRLLWG